MSQATTAPSRAVPARELLTARARLVTWPIALIVVAMAGIAIWNAATYPTIMGYDAIHHTDYARILVQDGRLPTQEEVRGSYKPPLYYAVAGVAVEAARELGAGEPERTAHVLNVVFLVAAAFLLLLWLRLLWPHRPLLHAAALAFLAFSPGVLKMTAMFHPAALALLLSTAALFLATRVLIVRERRSRTALALLGVLACGILVMPHLLWIAIAIVLVMVAALARERRAGRTLTVLVLPLVAGIALGMWWYAGRGPVYSEVIRRLDDSTQRSFWTENRPVHQWLEFGEPEVVTRPYRPSYQNAVVPTAYSELWGDYFGAFAWLPPDPPSPGVIRELRLQSVLGVLPTAFALAGCLALLALGLRRRARAPGRLLVALVPLIAGAGFLYWSALSQPDGDLLKGTFMLGAAPAWAAAFGFALASLGPSRLRTALIAVFVMSAMLEVPFLLHGERLGGLL